jgi:nicotinate-nucleotide pyrophosphorylase
VRVREVAEAVSHAAGAVGKVESWKLDQAKEKLGAYADALALDQQFSSKKAKEVLGWVPQAPSVFEDLEQGSMK